MRQLLLVIALLLICPAAARANILIDTGVVDPNFANQIDFLDRNFYGRFEVADSVKMTDAEGYFVRDAQSFGGDSQVSLWLSLYKGDIVSPPGSPSEGALRPNLSNKLVSTNFSFAGGESFQGYKGINGALIDLEPGSYWVGLEGGDNASTGKVRSIGSGVAVDPLDQYTNRFDTGAFSDSSAKQFAFRTKGYTVPEPSTMLLLGGGLLGVWARRRRNK